MASFEIVSKYADQGIHLPIRKTADSAGYDFEVAEDTILYPYGEEMDDLKEAWFGDPHIGCDKELEPMTLKEVASYTKKYNIKPSLVPTGIKVKLDPGTYLQLSVRSSFPLKHWIIMGNSIGIIDADYYNNPDNEGHIYFQLINLSPFPIILKKGEAIGQGIIQKYEKTEDDITFGTRVGGFGSTDANNRI